MALKSMPTLIGWPKLENSMAGGAVFGASLKKKKKNSKCTTWEKERWIQTALWTPTAKQFEEKYTYTKQIMGPQICS